MHTTFSQPHAVTPILPPRMPDIKRHERRSSITSQPVGFVGLGAMGFGMASHLVKSGFNVRGFDVVPTQVAKFTDLGGVASSSPRDAATDAGVLVVVVANSAQADSVIFNSEQGAVQSLPFGSTIVLCATVPPSYHSSFIQQLSRFGRADINVLDAPISGGAVKAGLGQLTILTSGTLDARSAANDVITTMAEKIYPIPGATGVASTVKMINQLLAGVHIAAAAEAMAFASKLELNTRRVFEVVNSSSSWSWMFENRVQHMLTNDWTPKSALDIFVKDMVRSNLVNKSTIGTLISPIGYRHINGSTQFLCLPAICCNRAAVHFRSI